MVTSLYLIVDAGLTPSQLILIGVAQALVGLCCEVPVGAVADRFGHKRSLVVGQLLMGAGMLLTGLTTDFYLLVLTQMLWGLSWTFISGADVAWLTAHTSDGRTVPPTLAFAARQEQAGGALGIVIAGAIAWLGSLGSTIVVFGGAMLLVGLLLQRQFPDQARNDTSGTTPGVTQIFRQVSQQLRTTTLLLFIFAAAFAMHGVEGVFSRTFQLLLVGTDLPMQPVVWLTLISLAGMWITAFLLQPIQRSLQQGTHASRIFILTCLAGALGLVLTAASESLWLLLVSITVTHGCIWPVCRVCLTAWLNEHSYAQSRATLHSFLGMVEHLGKIGVGVTLGAALGWIDLSVAYGLCALSLFLAAAVAWRGYRLWHSPSG